MMIALIALLSAQSDPVSAAPPACPPTEQCARASAGQLFALADRLFAAGDAAGAAQILEALTQDKHGELRAEARFRLAAVREKTGDLAGSAEALRALLAEQPSANRARLELARILKLMGKASEAGSELAKAERVGLPPEVEANVRRFSATLATPRRRGLTIEATAGPDSNINRSTGSQFIDTIIAPFELDADARRRPGIGYSLSARAYSRDRLGPLELTSHLGARADLYDQPRFNDVQFSLDSGPEFTLGKLQLRPSALYERRWYGGRQYSTGFGGDVDLVAPLGPRTQLALSASRVRQNVARNDGQDGWRTAAGVDLVQALPGRTTVRLSLRHGRLDARVRPESLRQWGGGLLVAREFRAATLFAEGDYTRTHGVEPLFLFGKTRRDSRWDWTIGAILTRARFGGFSPLLRLTHSDSRANIVLYDFRRTRLDVGFTRSF